MFAPQAILDAIAQAVIATDDVGAIVSWNRAAEESYGLNAASAGTNIGDLAPQCGIELLDELRKERSLPVTRRIPKNGHAVLLTASTIRDDKGNVSGFVIVFTEVPASLKDGERDELEGRLLQAERISSLGRLAASVAHEFNNVLMGIQPFVDLLTRRAGHDPTVKVAAPRIADAVARGKRVTQEILRFTRIPEPARAPTCVLKWLQAFQTEMAQLAGPRVIVTIEAAPDLTMLADGHQLSQVFTNLVSNARDAMPAGGNLDIRAAPDSMRNRAGQTVEAVHFRICDTGAGMPAETLEYIFEPLFTTKKFGGTGLGLAIASQVVKQHDGHIYAESTPGQGTTFHILIPAASSSSATEVASQKAPVRSSGVREGMHVMLIEDDEAIAAGLVAILECEGISIDLVRLGAEANDRLAARLPDVVILDVGLPDIDGMTLYRQIAARWPDLPVLFSTGHGDEKLLTHGSSGAHVGYLQKPYDAPALFAALDALLLARPTSL
jgi:PAS domain S-box-containing protein